ncbi:MAG: T9SS C-terminal target domain-containing protein, partial [Chlorobiota bacterium]
FISLKVYNTLGVEVKTLVNQVLSAGSYSIEFNADGLNSGVLFYTLSSNNFKYTRKMILTK